MVSLVDCTSGASQVLYCHTFYMTRAAADKDIRPVKEASSRPVVKQRNSWEIISWRTVTRVIESNDHVEVPGNLLTKKFALQHVATLPERSEHPN